MPTDNDDESWRLRQEVWDDPRVMLGGSDAGAHLDRMCGAPYTTRLLADCLRGRKLASLERAVQMMTEAPAELFGLLDRGTIAEGDHADLVVFDPETVGAGERPPGRRPARRHGPAHRRVRGRRAGLRRRRRPPSRTARPPAPPRAGSCARASTRSPPRSDPGRPAATTLPKRPCWAVTGTRRVARPECPP